MTRRPVAHCTYNARRGTLTTTRRLHMQAAHKACEHALLRDPRPDRRPDRRHAIRAAWEIAA